MLKRSYRYIQEASFFDEIKTCKNKLQDELIEKSVAGITLFINASDKRDFFEKRESIRSLFEEIFLNLPISVIAQPAGTGTAMEVWTHDNCINIAYKNCWGINYTVLSNSWGELIIGMGLSTNNPEIPFRKQASHSFELMEAVLSTEGFSMDNIIRQWNYIPEILKTSVENGRLFQNYQLFNDIRQYYYGIYKRNTVYPAATGIGMATGPVTIDFLAVKQNEATTLKGIKNPQQTDAYQYGQKVLIGSALKENEIKKAPLFERAKYIGIGSEGIVFISGTASIIGEKTIGIDDISEQTNVTVTNISNLMSPENLNNMGIQSQEQDYSYFRAYIKKSEDFDIIKKYCEKYYSGVPVLYVKADVCRNDLLMEIEGELVIR